MAGRESVAGRESGGGRIQPKSFFPKIDLQKALMFVWPSDTSSLIRFVTCVWKFSSLWFLVFGREKSCLVELNKLPAFPASLLLLFCLQHDELTSFLLDTI